MALVVPAAEIEDILEAARSLGEEASIIGEILPGKRGVNLVEAD
jgi:hydrogenase maturation factor